MVDIILAVIALTGTIFAFLKSRQKGQHQERQQYLEIQLAEVNARREAEKNDAANTKTFLELLELALSRIQEANLQGIERIVASQTESRTATLDAIKKMNDQALILMSQAGKNREDFQTAALETFYTLPELTRQKLHQSFKQVSLEVGDAILPYLNELQGVVVKAINVLEQRLMDAITPQPDSMQAMAQRDIRSIKDDCQTLFERLNDIHDVLQQIRPETAESTEVKPETFPDPVESTADEAHPLGES